MRKVTEQFLGLIDELLRQLRESDEFVARFISHPYRLPKTYLLYLKHRQKTKELFKGIAVTSSEPLQLHSSLIGRHFMGHLPSLKFKPVGKQMFVIGEDSGVLESGARVEFRLGFKQGSVTPDPSMQLVQYFLYWLPYRTPNNRQFETIGKLSELLSLFLKQDQEVLEKTKETMLSIALERGYYTYKLLKLQDLDVIRAEVARMSIPSFARAGWRTAVYKVDDLRLRCEGVLMSFKNNIAKVLEVE